jgi:hypothetical protein
MDSEKKFFLDELPDEGGPSHKKEPSALKESPSKKKQEQDPRLKKIQNLSQDERTEILSKRWRFDKPEYHFGWVAYICLLAALRELDFYDAYIVEKLHLDSATMGLGTAFLKPLFLWCNYFIEHPVFFALLTPVLFKFRTQSYFYLELSFDGVETVRGFNLNSDGVPDRVSIHWKEIVKVDKIKWNKRDALALSSEEKKLGFIIWDLKLEEKQAITVLLEGLVTKTHPLRAFIEKDLK